MVAAAGSQLARPRDGIIDGRGVARWPDKNWTGGMIRSLALVSTRPASGAVRVVLSAHVNAAATRRALPQATVVPAARFFTSGGGNPRRRALPAPHA